MWRNIIALFLFSLIAAVTLYEFFNRESLALKLFPLLFFIFSLIAAVDIIINLLKKDKQQRDPF